MLCMHYYVSLFSSLTYWWANWLLALGYKKHLELSDLGVVPERHEAKYNHEKFRTAFREEAVSSRTGLHDTLTLDRNSDSDSTNGSDSDQDWSDGTTWHRYGLRLGGRTSHCLTIHRNST